jgi:hypothetical protein
MYIFFIILNTIEMKSFYLALIVILMISLAKS